ncbi:gastric triacylglycerol lipase-like [Malurus melanocephalus]|uniref:gastric triacylglycerol lipase-like n=1 Tax=Malurus melanocephalus TaxID=175006 RepID=UPI002547CB7C|nr:gastric triacylglycerol lipase-like [Malurus melanocephalus]
MWLALALVSILHGVTSGQCPLNFPFSKNPEAGMNISEIISFWGYPSEEYDVVTEDGYILQLNRIPHGRENAGCQGPRPVVLLQHGILSEGSIWLSNLANSSLGFILADAGYDVWLGNSRGNTWSKRHLVLSPKQDEFWAFSFDEMARYDLPAMINFIEQKTGQKQLYYIGHSQGTTIGFIAFSTMPQLARKIKVFLALAPVTTVIFARSPFRKLTIFSESGLKEIFGTRDFLPHTPLGELLLSRFCVCSKICKSALAMVFGFNWKNTNMSRIDVFAGHTPAGSSVRNIIHWLQGVQSGALRAFDGGLMYNNLRYRQTGPPQYDVGSMEVPMAVWNAGQDCLSDPRDTALLLPQLRNLVHHKFIPQWNHLDFMLGLDATEVLYREILDVMKKHP